MATLTPMTELEAINDMLSVIGESPVASLAEAATVPDAQMAQALLTRYSRAVQEVGWDWNTETDYSLPADTSGIVYVPPNTLDVDPSDPTLDYVQRDGKLWDRTNKTYTIGKSVPVNITLMYEFEQLPSKARRYIATIAGVVFEARTQGNPGIVPEENREVIAAYGALLEAECSDAGLNVFDDSVTLYKRRRWRPVTE